MTVNASKLNQPNLSIFSKILAVKNTLPHTQLPLPSDHNKVFFFSCCIWPFQVFSSILTPKAFVHQKSDVLEGILITLAFQKTPSNLLTRGHDSKSIGGGRKTSRVICAVHDLYFIFPPQERMEFYKFLENW